MSAQTIYTQLIEAGMSVVGACAMLGNMKAESNLCSNIVQHGLTSINNEEYTEWANQEKNLNAFAHDEIGYGLCQWTYWARKYKLAQYAKIMETNIGTEWLQVKFCIGELKGKASLWKYLCETDNLYEATSRICKEYENPDIKNIDTRYTYALDFYNQATNGEFSEQAEEVEEMSIVEKAISQMESWARDDTHGYDQSNRWGPNYDCSSAVIQAWENAGIPVKSNGATYTGNMYSVFTKCGFVDITSSVNLASGAGLARGDILLNHVHHTAMYCGNGQIVQASINEYGTTTGGQSGDQTGREFYIRSYYNYPWDCVLRYQGADTSTNTSPIIEAQWPPRLLTYRKNRKLTKGLDVYACQALLNCRGYNLELDGEYGQASANAVLDFQKANGLEADGDCGNDTWNMLLKK